MDKCKKIRKGNLCLRIQRNLGLYLMLLPAVFLLICFSYRPMYGVLIAFKDYRASEGILGSAWAEPWYKYFQKFFQVRIVKKFNFQSAFFGGLGNFYFSAENLGKRKFRFVIIGIAFLCFFYACFSVLGLMASRKMLPARLMLS